MSAAANTKLIYLLGSWNAFEAKLRSLVFEAAENQAGLVVFPEYAGLELAGLGAERNFSSLKDEFTAAGQRLPDYLSLLSTLAKETGLYIMGGSLPIQVEKTECSIYHNRAYFFSPDGYIDFQDKVMMTRFENEDWHVSGNTTNAEAPKVFDTPFGPIGIAICYDSEFPVLVRRLVKAGTQLIVVPSCTDTPAGFNRVRIACRARAMENQCFVIQSPLVGTVDWLQSVDLNIGRAGIFSPVDRGLPEDGILAQGTMNRPEWVFAQLDFDKMREVRQNGQVLNHLDWDKLEHG